MQVKLLVGLAGGISLSPGDILTCDDAEAIRLCDAGAAVPVAKTKVERAVKKPAEKRG